MGEGPDSQAHPRSRGENSPARTSSSLSWGSSPLTRGKRCAQTAIRRPSGLIPAHAGKTEGLPGPRGLPRAHPRSRGENRTRRLMTRPSRGSSPLTRGKRGAASAGGVHRGLIPAHAGKTGGRMSRLVPSGAHPRSRGENGERIHVHCWVSGSSPLTRGKRFVFGVDGDADGLIPAHAGKTSRVLGSRSALRAHPRSRGENLVDKPNVLAHLGSSPLTRGKPSSSA